MPEYTGSEEIHSGGQSALSTTNTYANSMRLFGLPYQFISTTDPRMPNISSSVGVNFMDKIMLQAPVATIIPGKAVYLPGVKKRYREGIGTALIAAGNGNVSPLANIASTNPTEKLRYYDFQEDYTSYMKYVNVMCRTVAGFLELEQTISSGNNQTDSFQFYDWKNYRWNKPYYSTGSAWQNFKYIVKSGVSFIRNTPTAMANIFRSTPSAVQLDTVLDAIPNEYTSNYVQFYVDPSSAATESMSNASQQSFIKGAVDTGSGMMREINFLSNSVGTGVITNGAESLMESVLDPLGDVVSLGGNWAFGNILNNIFSVGTRVIKGENIILPDVYQSSEYGVDYTLDIHLRSPYGNKFSRFMDVIVPLLHLIALCLPRQATSNTYGSPFLVKVHYPGVFDCNLGLVESLSINIPSNEDAWNNDGLPMEAHCQLRIKDLYSDLTMSPANEPALFHNNTSLINYLATLSGLSLIEPQTTTKLEMILNNLTASMRDIPDNAMTLVSDAINRGLSGMLRL